MESDPIKSSAQVSYVTLGVRKATWANFAYLQNKDDIFSYNYELTERLVHQQRKIKTYICFYFSIYYLYDWRYLLTKYQKFLENVFKLKSPKDFNPGLNDDE